MAKFYDHAANQTNAAVGYAMAKARRACLTEGTAFRVEANWKGKERFYWTGCEYDVTCLERELRLNGAENVIVAAV